MPEARRHKWVALWFRELYLELGNGLFRPNSTAQCIELYRRVLNWLDEPAIKVRSTTEIPYWIEFFANRYHYHQRKTEMGISEGDLLPHIRTGDRPEPENWVPVVKYRVALDNLRSAHNVGSIFRTSDAAGFESVVVGGNTPGKGHSQVEKAAMHSTRWIPQESAEHLATQLATYRKQGYRIIGIETALSSESYWKTTWPKQAVIVMGNEEYGLSQDCLRICDQFVHIPMHGHKNSINVANAFAVIAFHICSQILDSKEN